MPYYSVMIHFLLKLVPPRPTFPEDMTEAEGKVMAEHAVYWKGLTDKGIVLVFGPVLDPKGTWGMGVVEVETEADARAIIANDPVSKSGLGAYEISPMRVGMARK
jgi:uncharacterized protein YciI